MILNHNQILERDIVQGKIHCGDRATTYDATVGSIISNGSKMEGDAFRLPSRGVVWVVSAEEFNLPSDITGLATLKTTWTHKGVLALNVGVIDPGWKGTLSAAILNFGKDDFLIKIGDPFFRVLFLQNEAVDLIKYPAPKIIPTKYISDTSDRSLNTTDTFLNIEKLSKEVLFELNGSTAYANKMAKAVLIITVIAVAITILSAFIPLGFSIYSDYYSMKSDVGSMKGFGERIDKLQVDSRVVDSQLLELKKKLDALQMALPTAAQPSLAVSQPKKGIK